MLRLGVIGRSELMYNSLLHIMDKGYRPAYVITAKAASEYKRNERDFEKICAKYNIPFLITANLNSDASVDFLKRYGKVDIVISVNFTGIISQDIISTADICFLNAHGGDLPRYRGNACQAWALLNGEQKIAVCIHKMIGDELDSGDIIEREFLTVNHETKIADVWQWMVDSIPELFLSAIRQLEENSNYILEKQSTNTDDILRCYPRTPEDAKINWSDSSINICRLINASGKPYDGAYTEFKDKVIRIWDVELYEDGEIFCAIPGQILKILNSGSIIIACGKNTKLKINWLSINDESQIRASTLINSTRQRLK